MLNATIVDRGMDIEIVKLGFELVKGAKENLARKPEDTRLNDDICKALRAIYFMPDGVLSLMKEVERGDKVSSDRIHQALTDFNDREWKVQGALEEIDIKRLAKDLRMTLRAVQTLEMIRYGKIGLRQEIQEEINYYGQRGAKPNREKLRELIASIEKLNAEIEAIEHLVNVKAKQRQ